MAPWETPGVSIILAPWKANSAPALPRLRKRKNKLVKASCSPQNPRCSKSHSAFDLFPCLIIFSLMYLRAVIAGYSKEEINGHRFTILQCKVLELNYISVKFILCRE